MLELRPHRRFTALAFSSLLLALFVSISTAGCESESKSSDGGGAGNDSCSSYRANCMTPDAAWQAYYAYERGSTAGAAGAAGAPGGAVSEGGAGAYPDECPPHNGVGPQVFAPENGSASCCYDPGDSDSCG